MASVKKEDIPMMAMFMPKLWELVKEFYLVELTDEYSKAAYDRCVELIEIYPDPLAREFVLAFCKFIDSKQKEMRKNVQTEVQRRAADSQRHISVYLPVHQRTSIRTVLQGDR